MDRINKLKAIGATKADAAADIALINQYSVKELKPEDVFSFSLYLCDNDVDRDTERFTDAALDGLAPLFLGKTGIMDHDWSAQKQTARIYRTEVVATGERNRLGEPLKVLRASAYMLKNERNQPIVEAIEGGILKEISIGCAMSKCSCSVCGEGQTFDWRTWKYQCENGHIRGEAYDGKLCVGQLEEPTEAYEFSFVAVPAQRAAGVIKGVIDLGDAFKLLMEEDLSSHVSEAGALLPRLQMALLSDEERQKRARILVENQKFMKSERN